MDNETLKKLAELEVKIDKIYQSAEKTRKYFLWTLIATVVVVVFPLIALLFVLPSFMTSYIGGLQGLGI